MKYATVCSGIEAPSAAWHPLGWSPVWFSEIEKFPKAVLNYHYPNVPDLGDMTKIKTHERFKETKGSINLICGGTPCQSFSIAGLRKGMDDPRGNLALVFLGIIDAVRPEWVVWENVPGVLSSWTDAEEGENGEKWQTNDFDTFLAGLKEIGYHCAWRILDAQYFGVPQRRRRIFVVGHITDWRRSAAVLFEPQSMQGCPAPSREAGQRIAGTIDASINSKWGSNQWVDSGCFCFQSKASSSNSMNPSIIAPSIDKGKSDGLAVFHSNGIGGDISNGSEMLVTNAEGSIGLPFLTASSLGNHVNNQTPLVAARLAATATLSTMDGYNKNTTRLVPELYSIMPQNSGKDYKARKVALPQPLMGTGLTGGNQGGDYLIHASFVRRLTPLECERLQGFPDGYTRIPYRGKPAAKCPDGPRYKALGNSMAVPVMKWIGERIDMVNKMT